MSEDPVSAAWEVLKRELVARYGLGGAADWLMTSAHFVRAEAVKQTERHVASAENVVGFAVK